MNPTKIAEIRETSGMNKGEFCRKYGIDSNTLKSWIDGERKPSNLAIKMLELAEKDSITRLKNMTWLKGKL